MKKILYIILFIIHTSIWAQTPQTMSYQAVVRDANGNLQVNSPIGLEIDIHQSTPNGTVVYTETQSVTTNENGLFTTQIGGQAGFDTIDWSAGPYFLETKIDLQGGTDYTITGTAQLLSVPYALHAQTAESITGSINETDPVFNAWDKSSGININESQITDLHHFTNADETDPVFAAWDKNYSDLINKPQIIDSITAVIDTTTQFVRKDTQWIQNGSDLYYENGSIGIGTAAPQGKLHISGVDNTHRLFVEGSGVTANLWNTTGSFNISTETSHDIRFFPGTNQKSLTLKTDGKIGVGTVNPAGVLDVVGSNGARIILGEQYLNVYGGSNAWDGYTATFRTATGSDPNGKWVGIGATDTYGWLTFGGSGGPGTRDLVLSNGNIGIGNVSPNAKLEINADGNRVGLIVKTNTSNTNHIQEWKNGNNITLNYVPQDGGIVFENLNTPGKAIKFMADQTVGVTGAYGTFQPVSNNTSGGLIVLPKGNGNSGNLFIFGTDMLADASNGRQLALVANNDKFYIWPRNYGTQTAKPFYIYKPGNLQDAAISIGVNGNVGVNTATPEAPLHIKDFMKLEPRDTPPASPAKGTIYYDSNDDKIKVYTGSVWEALN